MSYNVTALDQEGARATAYLAPDRPAHITSLPVATNHQEQVEWAPYAAASRSVERRQHLERQRGALGAHGRLKAILTRVPPGPDMILIRSATWRTSHNPCPGAPDIEPSDSG